MFFIHPVYVIYLHFRGRNITVELITNNDGIHEYRAITLNSNVWPAESGNTSQNDGMVLFLMLLITYTCI
jgi:uncharacterized membrane protein affecting hemolysin expression